MGQLAWKVLRPDRTSAVARGKYRLEYPVGVRVTPAEGSNWVLAFRNEEAAQLFADTEGRIDGQPMLVVSAEVEQMDVDTYRISMHADETMLDRYWRDKPGILQYPPNGTIFCSAITCLE